MDTYITDETVQKVWSYILDPTARKNAVERNFELAAHYFSFPILERKIKSILLNFGLSLF